MVRMNIHRHVIEAGVGGVYCRECERSVAILPLFLAGER